MSVILCLKNKKVKTDGDSSKMDCLIPPGVFSKFWRIQSDNGQIKKNRPLNRLKYNKIWIKNILWIVIDASIDIINFVKFSSICDF